MTLSRSYATQDQSSHLETLLLLYFWLKEKAISQKGRALGEGTSKGLRLSGT
ncbi:hypothetical protein TDIS_1064 [Thermosulfurimonas dismutans]|uniref:Uncharacterized protein n=1 Tax=Thermosulfurimonas dismutans TaxID=999894 RepID=A0A179D3Z1_9BACT|nr:hypothetical protein TDIS_1064 [Thermosulfurimonas dismutans]